MTRSSTSEALGGLLAAFEKLEQEARTHYDDAHCELFDGGLADALETARAALTSWRERLPLREDHAIWARMFHRTLSANMASDVLDALDRSLFSETPPVKEENRG